MQSSMHSPTVVEDVFVSALRLWRTINYNLAWKMTGSDLQTARNAVAGWDKSW